MTDAAHVIFRLSSRDLTGEVNLKPEAWRILAQVNGTRTVAEIAQNLRIDVALTARVATSLVEAGLLELAPGSAAPPPPVVPNAFFDFVTRELTRVLGPIASIILEDEMIAFGETREQFPRERIAELIERLSAEIRDETKRLHFQQIMLDAIRKL